MISQKTGYKIYLFLAFFIFALPLLSLKPLFAPPDFAKTSIFLILSSILIFLLAYQTLFEKKEFKEITDRKNPVFLPFWILIGYCVWIFASAVFSLDIGYSLWGSPLRGGGSVAYILLILFSLLLFFILKAKDWDRVWNWNIIVGIIVSIIAIFQRFGIFGELFVGRFDRPVSTLNNPIFLALYLLVLFFISLSFFFFKKSKWFYFFSCLLFLFVIFISGTRAALLGAGLGLMFFAFFFPSKSQKAKRIKIAAAGIVISSVILFFWLNTQPQLVQRISKNRIIGITFSRIWTLTGNFSLYNIFASRASGWEMAVKAIKDRPIFGYGPENFSIAFDKYYNPNLPGIGISSDISQGRTTWWDKAHSFFFEIGSTCGIPALIAYLSVFGILFWKLRKEKSAIKHGIQAGFIAYLVADFFSIDSFSTNLVAFSLVSYSLFLLRGEKPEEKILPKRSSSWKYVFLFFLAVFLLVFSWSYSVKPLLANKELNKIIYWSEHKQCDAALKEAERATSADGSISAFAKLTYLDIVGECSPTQTEEKKIELYHNSISRLKELMLLRPYYTRTWYYYVFYATKIIEKDQSLSKEMKDQFSKEASASFEKAKALSPNRPIILAQGAKFNLAIGNFSQAQEIVDQCLKISSQYPDCWWARAEIYLKSGNISKGSEIINSSLDMGLFDFPDHSYTDPYIRNAIVEFINFYNINKIRDYNLLARLYQKIIIVEYESFQHHASLAYVYKELGQYQKAREEAAIVLKLSPESKPIVEEFLKTLPHE